MSNVVQSRDGVQVSRISLFSGPLPPSHHMEVPGVLAVVPQEGDRLSLSSVSDVRTVSPVNENLVISVSPT